IGLNDYAVVTEDQVETVRVVGYAADAARRDNPAQYFGEILLTHDTRLPGGRLTAFGELFTDAVLAAVGGDGGLPDAGERFDLDCILRGPDAHTLEGVRLVECKDGADRYKTFSGLRLCRRGRDELQIEDIVERLAGKGRDQLRCAPALGARQAGHSDDVELGISARPQHLNTGDVENRQFEGCDGFGTGTRDSRRRRTRICVLRRQATRA